MKISRAAWRARAPKPGPGALVPSNVLGIALHWPATSKPLHGIEMVSAGLRGWQAYHMDDRGWSDIAYQVAVDQDGNRYELRGLANQSGANGDVSVNRKYGAALLVLAPGEKPSAAMVVEVQSVVRDFRALFPDAKAIVGHGQIRPEPTACPGPAVNAAIKAGAFEPPTRVRLVDRPRARVAAVNMHAPGTDDSVRMDRAVAQFNHLGFTIAGLSEFNAAMLNEIDPRPYWMVHRAQPNTGSSGNAVAWKSAVWTCLEAGVLPVKITGRTLHMAGVVLKHRRTGFVLPVLAIHNPPRAGKAATPQIDRDTCLEAEQAWVEQKTKECGRALVLGDFNQPDAFIKTLARGVGHNVDEVYGSGRVRFSGAKVHDGFVPNVTDHSAVSVLINVERS